MYLSTVSIPIVDSSHHANNMRTSCVYSLKPIKPDYRSSARPDPICKVDVALDRYRCLDMSKMNSGC